MANASAGRESIGQACRARCLEATNCAHNLNQVNTHVLPMHPRQIHAFNTESPSLNNSIGNFRQAQCGGMCGCRVVRASLRNVRADLLCPASTSPDDIATFEGVWPAAGKPNEPTGTATYLYKHRHQPYRTLTARRGRPPRQWCQRKCLPRRGDKKRHTPRNWPPSLCDKCRPLCSHKRSRGPMPCLSPRPCRRS